ncbi:hypothetical protein VTP01DRAFT_7948 [Rhizomucor pusillus]|uniref:uncharacterized protein n=1 Tax=Rhizomucor pusillus TaxID=4840 RepID=UPI0037447062
MTTKSKRFSLPVFRKRKEPVQEEKPVSPTDQFKIRNTIRRSLSAILYAPPQRSSNDEDKSSSGAAASLVPVLVTADVSDKIIADSAERKPEPINANNKQRKAPPVEYDNTLDVVVANKDDQQQEQLTLIWQGYGFICSRQELVPSMDKATLMNSYESQVWSEYRGLVHPLHLFEDAADERWSALTVSELQKYFNNYGSMLLKLRDASMRRQQQQYITMGPAASEWIIPQQTTV